MAAIDYQNPIDKPPAEARRVSKLAVASACFGIGAWLVFVAGVCLLAGMTPMPGSNVQKLMILVYGDFAIGVCATVLAIISFFQNSVEDFPPKGHNLVGRVISFWNMGGYCLRGLTLLSFGPRC